MNIHKCVREWSKNDKAWWAHHELRLRGQHGKQRHESAYVHYNACAALTNDIEQVFGVAVAENTGDALPCPPAARMPRTLVAFKEALRGKAADDCFPFGAQAKTVSVMRQVALVELLEVQYTDLPLQEAQLIALVQRARQLRKSQSSEQPAERAESAVDGTESGGASQPIAAPITGDDVVAHLMAYIKKRDHLEENAAFLGVKGKPEAEQRESLQALVEDAQETLMTASVATQAMYLRQLAASVAYYGYLQMTQQ